tara:strand:- start:118 stop:357 length:240 start_codon:yes stop_codon:yes gene_type:complete
VWAYALIVVLASGEAAPIVKYMYLDHCRWQAQEFMRDQKYVEPVQSAVCTPVVVSLDEKDTLIVIRTRAKPKEEEENND